MTCWILSDESKAICELAEGNALHTIEQGWSDAAISSALNTLSLCVLMGCSTHAHSAAGRRLRGLLAKLDEERREAEREEALSCCDHHCARCTP